MKRPAKKRPPSLLGLVFEAKKVHVVYAARVKESIDAEPAATFECDALAGDPLVVGKELHAQLEQAGFKEKRCIASIPSEWLMTVQSVLPELAAADADSFLQLEAERGFPCELDELQIARSSQTVSGVQTIIQIGVRTSDINRLVDLLTAAGLRPVSFTIGLATLPGALPPADQGLATLSLAENPPTLLIAAGGEIAAVRAIAAEPGEAATLAREVRISIEEMPVSLRALVNRLHVHGETAEVAAFTALMSSWAKGAGIRIESDTLASPATALALATFGLVGTTNLPDLLPPRPSRFQQILRRYNSRRLGTVIAIGVAAVLILVGAFAWREYESWQLRDEWAKMKPQVDVLDGVQARIREFRPWHDTSYRTLNVLRLITDVFPENGSVTAKSFEIRNQTTVTVTGVTRDNTALLHSLDKLRQRSEVANLKIEQIRGKSPAQFTFSFHVTRTPGS